MPRTRDAARYLAVAVFLLVVASPTLARETGTSTGQVTFRVTLSGPVDEADAFVVFTRCSDEWCDENTSADYPAGQTVVACGKGLADQVVCSATTYEWTVELETGLLEYDFVRTRDVLRDQEDQLQHSGTWQIHSGHQVISLGYAYPSTDDRAEPGGDALPDTAMSLP